MKKGRFYCPYSYNDFGPNLISESIKNVFLGVPWSLSKSVIILEISPLVISLLG